VLRERYAEITAMDRAIGTLRQHLASKGLKENTLLFYCGDNGTSADAALGVPHRGVKGQVYEGGVLVPGLIEWPARITEPRRTSARACTSDLLPTICAITGQPLPHRPLDGIDLGDVIDGKSDKRPSPLCFWEYNYTRLKQDELTPWIDPALQRGTTPLVKLMNGKATRDFTNFRQPAITDADYSGQRAIIDGEFKLVIHEARNGPPEIELFDLEADPAEKVSLLKERPALAAEMQSKLLQWQESVLHSLTGADYVE
jgi:arylsulfatase A-like enzyme